jgi:hypothetical protein
MIVNVSTGNITYRDIISPPDPATQALRELAAPEPKFPFTLDDSSLEERAHEENCG